MFTRHFRLHSALIGFSFGFLSIAATAQPAAKPSGNLPPPPNPNATQEANRKAPSGEPFTTPIKSETSTSNVPAAATDQGAPAPTGDPWGIAQAPTAPAPSSEPNAPAYLVEPVPAPRAESPNAQDASSVPPPPMNLVPGEPPPPPVPRHIAPRTSFWVGARAGWWIPFGDLWGACNSSGYDCSTERFSAVASSGPMMELDIGARLGRNYNLYALWERAQLGRGDGIEGASQIRAESDYFALGVRLSADPDDIGLLLDLSIGARRFRAIYEGRQELQLTHAPLESRLGIGVDIRLSETFSLSPMATLGLGGFGKAEWVTRDTVTDYVPPGYDELTHGWFTIQMGGHFDIAGSSR